jgi:hypothetical protein
MAPAYVAAKIKALAFNIGSKYTLFHTAKDTISSAFCLILNMESGAFLLTST